MTTDEASRQIWQERTGVHTEMRGKPLLVLLILMFFMTLHVQEMYNFNPGAADIATGIPDPANGIFEITGLAKQYLNVSQISRTVQWTGEPSAVKFVTPADPRRERQPADNRRVRNRL
jgi:hypothetical protein